MHSREQFYLVDSFFSVSSIRKKSIFRNSELTSFSSTQLICNLLLHRISIVSIKKRKWKLLLNRKKCSKHAREWKKAHTRTHITTTRVKTSSSTTKEGNVNGNIFGAWKKAIISNIYERSHFTHTPSKYKAEPFQTLLRCWNCIYHIRILLKMNWYWV